MKKTIGISFPLPGPATASLEAKYRIVIRDPQQESFQSWFDREASELDGLISMLSDPLTATNLAKGTRLQAVANYAVGYNNIDTAAAQNQKVVVMNTPDVLTETSADFAWALMMAAARRIVEGDAMTRAGKFTGWQPELLLGQDLYGSTLGIVGAGRIGRAVAARAKGFNMRVLYHNRTRLAPALEEELNLTYTDLDTLLQSSDFVSLHCPLTPDTEHLIGPNQLDTMKANAILVNTARGPVVDELALIDALVQKSIAGAALDVYEWEPEISDGLLHLDNVVLAPHAASASQATREKMAWMVCEDVAAVLEGNRPKNPVN